MSRWHFADVSAARAFRDGWAETWRGADATRAGEPGCNQAHDRGHLVDHNQLAEAYARDPRLTGFMAIQPSSTTPVAFMLDINRWLDRSGVTIRLDA